MAKFKKIIPDTSILIEGTLSKKIENKEISVEEIIIHNASLSELESQANKNREIGYLGLDEVKKLRLLGNSQKFKVSYKGERPAEFEINFAKSGEIDALIRNLAGQEDGTLFTADKVQALVAESIGIKNQLIEFPKKKNKAKIEKYFDDKTMSVHLKEDVKPGAKKGGPGNWKFVELSKTKLSQSKVKEIANDIIDIANSSRDGFIEVSRKGSTIVQLGRFRIVITKPPFSDGWEITAVRPVKTLSFSDYKLTDKLKNRVSVQAEGILIAGSPGMGKSTFAQALAEYYVKKDKIVKTVEAPRDLVVSDAVTQYSLTLSSHDEIHDILLLSRPDYTFFDEIRNFSDFKVFADLRLAGVGMVGVVHATNPIDAIQRFLGKIELGVIPQVVDTVIFIQKGAVAKVLSMKMGVKVPSGMQESDLARPVVSVSDFETGKEEFEIYTYGEQTVVIPVQKTQGQSPIQKYAAEEIERRLSKEIGPVTIEVLNENRCAAYVPEKNIAQIIGKQGQNIEKIEQWIGLSLDIRPLQTQKKFKEELKYQADFAKKNLTLKVEEKATNKDIDIHINGEFLLTAKVSKGGTIKIKNRSAQGREIITALDSGKDVKLYY